MLTAVIGLVFWFFLGFPFGNHNESYSWVAQFNTRSFADLMIHGVFPISNFRPFGIATAWFTYTVSGSSIVLQQLLNFVVTACAWLIVWSALREKAKGSLCFLLAGLAFFPGYIYLFHLHGVFYSPLLLFCALLFSFAMRKNIVSGQERSALFILMIGIALYHPFSIPIYVAFMAGYFVMKRKILSRRDIISGCILILLSCVIALLLIPGRGLFIRETTLPGFITSYRTVELKSVISLLSWGLCIVTIVSSAATRKWKIFLAAIITLSAVLLVELHIPILLLWIAVCLLKLVLSKRWSLVTMLTALALLPMITATGSPTYTVFALLVCTATVPMDWPLFESRSKIHDIGIVTVIMVMLLTFVVLKSNIRVPIMSALSSPLRAEQEKTQQLEKIIRWWQDSPYADHALFLAERADDPVISNNVIDRRFRPPTSQQYLDIYAVAINRDYPRDFMPRLLISFGGQKIPDAQMVFSIEGTFAGNAAVYRFSN